jgi:hypothetical protein
VSRAVAALEVAGPADHLREDYKETRTKLESKGRKVKGNGSGVEAEASGATN